MTMTTMTMVVVVVVRDGWWDYSIMVVVVEMMVVVVLVVRVGHLAEAVSSGSMQLTARTVQLELAFTSRCFHVQSGTTPLHHGQSPNGAFLLLSVRVSRLVVSSQDGPTTDMDKDRIKRNDNMSDGPSIQV